MEFEWDPKKRLSNFDKHGVLFEDAIAVFDDPLEITELARSVADEIRLQTLGKAGPLAVLFVIHTLRRHSNSQTVIRIISARRVDRKGSDMSNKTAKDEEPKYVRYVRKPLTQEQLDRLEALSKLPDESIDLSDIPELDDEFFKNAKQGVMYRMMKQQTTLRLDADILDWFKRHAKNGKGYQTDINKALRAYVEAQERKSRKKAG